jgi:hypothetical protein
MKSSRSGRVLGPTWRTGHQPNGKTSRDALPKVSRGPYSPQGLKRMPGRCRQMQAHDDTSTRTSWTSWRKTTLAWTVLSNRDSTWCNGQANEPDRKRQPLRIVALLHCCIVTLYSEQKRASCCCERTRRRVGRPAGRGRKWREPRNRGTE